MNDGVVENMSYTTQSMMAHAQLHFASAQKALAYAERAEDDGWVAIQSMKASAEAQAGLLAVELARYAGGFWGGEK